MKKLIVISTLAIIFSGNASAVVCPEASNVAGTTIKEVVSNKGWITGSGFIVSGETNTAQPWHVSFHVDVKTADEALMLANAIVKTVSGPRFNLPDAEKDKQQLTHLTCEYTASTGHQVIASNYYLPVDLISQLNNETNPASSPPPQTTEPGLTGA